VVRKLTPLRIADLGGASGVVCFAAAAENPASQFMIIDRSRNALLIGRNWAQRLGIKNISFVRKDFADATIYTLGSDFDLVLLEYVLFLASDYGEEESAIAEVTPAVLATAKILNARGTLQVRFGDFNELAVSALVRSAFRTGLFVDSVSAHSTGCTIRSS
jgi:hypothetical protein